MADVYCSSCGAPLPFDRPDLPAAERVPCLICGNRGRNFKILLKGSLAPAGTVTARLVGAVPRIVEAVGSAAGTSQAVGGVAIPSSLTLYPPSVTVQPPQSATVDAALFPDVLLRAQLVDFGDRTSEGQLVVGVSVPWWEIIRHVQNDPTFLYTVPWRKLEELVAGAFERDGWPEVVLTPRSGDKGRDVIATKPGVGSIRIIGQVKAYKPGHLVTAEEVDAVLGALLRDRASKAIVTTTSGFAPGVLKDERLALEMPYRLELMDGQRLWTWLLAISRQRSGSVGTNLKPGGTS